MKFMLLDS